MPHLCPLCVRCSLRPEAGVPLSRPLLARTGTLLHGSQFPRQTALGGCHGVRGGRRAGLTGEGRGRRSEYLRSRRRWATGGAVWLSASSMSADSNHKPLRPQAQIAASSMAAIVYWLFNCVWAFFHEQQTLYSLKN